MKKILTLLVILFVSSIDVYALDNVVKTKLPSGQTVIIHENHTNPIVMIDTWVKTGSIDEQDKNNGVAHFLEHLFFKGSKNYPANEFDKILEAKGGVTNAATSKDYTHFYILIPSKDFETAVKLHADMLSRPLFPVDEIEKERHVVIREIERSNDSPERILYKSFNRELYPSHPYRREVLGTKEIIASIPREEILKFYREHYSPKNLITVVSGDVNTEDAIKLIRENFSDSKTSGKVVKNKYKKDKKPNRQIRTNVKEDVNTTSLIIGFKCGLAPKDKDYFALDVLGTILGYGKSSRFYKELIDKHHLATNIDVSNPIYKQDSVFYINSVLQHENLENLEKAVFQEIEKVKENGVTKEEVQRAKKVIERMNLYANESVEDVANELGYCMLLTDDWNYFDEYLEKIRKVTPKDVQRAAKKYLNENSAIISSLTPKNYLPEQKTQNQINENEKNTDLKITKHMPLKTEKSGNIVKYTLDNNAVLLIDKHKNNDIIAVNMIIKGGNYLTDTIGIPDLTASLLLKDTEKYPKTAFAEISDENGIKMSASASKEYFEIVMKYTKPDAETAKDLFNQAVNHAVFTEEEFSTTKNLMLETIKQVKDNAMKVAFEEMSHEVWKNSPYDNSIILMEKNAEKISLEDIKNYYSGLFDANNTIISVNGNVNEQEMIDYFSELIKPKTTKKFHYNDSPKTVKPIEKNKILIKNQGKEAAWIVLAWRTDGNNNKKDRAALRVVNAILGSGMSSRLFTNVRAEKGLAYAIGSKYYSFANHGVFCIFIGTEPSKADEAQAAILKETEKLKKEFISDKELEDAKNQIKGNVVLAMETNATKANATAIAEQNGNGYDFYFDKFNGEIDGVTVSDVINAANKYFSKPFIISKVLPKK